jgi:hypothetical protein
MSTPFELQKKIPYGDDPERSAGHVAGRKFFADFAKKAGRSLCTILGSIDSLVKSVIPAARNLLRRFAGFAIL